MTTFYVSNFLYMKINKPSSKKINIKYSSHILKYQSNNSSQFLSPVLMPLKMIFIIFTQPLRSGRIWHKVNF